MARADKVGLVLAGGGARGVIRRDTARHLDETRTGS
jgi:predicted patatin/cPLA2 family phospholipase